MLAPALTTPVIGLLLVGAVVAVWLADKSVAYPLALAGIPSLVTAIVGSNPLPKGGATFLIASWILLAVALVIVRRKHMVALGGLLSFPVAMAVLLLGLMLVRVDTSPDQAYGLMKVQLYTADNLVFLVGAIFVGAERRSFGLFFILLLAVFAAGSLVLVGSLVSGTAQQQYGVTSGRFTISAQQGAINLGRDSATGALIAIWLILMSRRTAVRLAAVAALPALLVALVAAGSRGPTVAFVIGLLTLVGLTAATGRARRRLLAVAAAMVGAAIVIPLVVPGSSISRSLSTIIGSASGLSSNGRSSLWAEAFTTFGQHTLVGIGTGGYAAIEPNEMFPHNILLEVSVELGVLGLFAVGALLLSMLARLRTLWQGTTGTRQLQVTLLIALFVSALVNAMFSGAIQDNSDLWLWGGLGIGMYASGETGARSRTAAAFASRSSARRSAPQPAGGPSPPTDRRDRPRAGR